MATSNVTGRAEPGISKYCITFGVSLAALILAGGVLVFSYWQHVELLHEGDSPVRQPAPRASAMR